MGNGSFQSSFVFDDDRVIGLKRVHRLNPYEYDVYNPNEDLSTNIEYGDLFRLGEHRLLCGDSTNKEDMVVLMDGGSADITFTSPPYNTHSESVHIGFHHKSNVKVDNYYSNNESVYLCNGDDLTHEEYGDFLCRALMNSLEYTDDALFNIGVLAGSKIGLTRLLYEFNNVFCDIIVWEKNTSMPLGLPSQKPMLSHRAELIFCFNKDGTRKFTHSQWDKGTKDNIINTSNNSSNNYANYNKGVFPLEFAMKIVEDFSENSVLDIFGGMGTTLIACETLNRKCYMMELDPLSCQIIINRWETFTSQKAKKI